MKEPKTIQEAITLLQKSIEIVLPGMAVAVNISLAAKEGVKAVEQLDIEPEVAKKIDMEALRAVLNAYAKKVGPTDAIELVKSFTGGSKNPVDIPVEKYNDLLDAIGEIEIELKKDANKEAA